MGKDNEKTYKTIEYDGKTYELKYNLKRIELIENATGTPILASMQNGMMRISHLKAYIGYGLKEEGADTFVNPKVGLDVAEALIETQGYVWAGQTVAEALERDCPFFFRVD